MDAQARVDQAKAAMVGRDRHLARQLLAEVVTAEPNHAEAWLLLASVVEDVDNAVDCLRRVLALNPDNNRARERLTQALREKARRVAVAEMQAEAGAAGINRPVPRLGEYLLDFKFVSAEALEAALQLQQQAQQAGQARRLGDILVQQGLVTEERLNFAVREQERSLASLFDD
jgi:tetratricopeptide (TPR) repeat protein